MTNSSLSGEAAKRAAALAVSRFGADRKRVNLAFQSAVKSQADGIEGDLVDLLVAKRLLTDAQADALRAELRDMPPDEPLPALFTPPPAAPTPTNEETAQPPVPPTRSGYILRNLGDYRLLRRLGEGGMGSVYLAFDERLKRQVALKVLADQLARNEAYVERFHREAKSGSALDHPNIVRCITAGWDEASGKHYLVMEYVEGPSARSLLERLGRLSVGDAVAITLDMARALEHIHGRSYIHRDIKPDNILISAQGTAKLADLGLAKRTDDASNLTASRQGFGTPFYMPCEQADDAKVVDGRSDIYALGASLYHLITGEVPFPGDTHAEVTTRKLSGIYAPASVLNPGVPPALDSILDKMLQRSPSDRYQSATELILDLEATGLSAQVPSFTDPDLAIEETPMRAPLQATRLDLDAIGNPQANGSAEVWHVRWSRPDGAWFELEVPGQQMAERVCAGEFPANAEASIHRNEGYRNLTDIPELAKYVPATAPGQAVNSPSGPVIQTLSSLQQAQQRSTPWPLMLGALAIAVVVVVGWLWINR